MLSSHMKFEPKKLPVCEPDVVVAVDAFGAVADGICEVLGLCMDEPVGVVLIVTKSLLVPNKQSQL